jgi:ParB family chromosome partitioning protein
MIKNIPIELIVPHPDNPRKDLGDLTELAESIKANGILQNLTVVPARSNGGYTVVIGHRRLAAAKLAGLTEVPCATTDMDQKQQVATMLTENMQRSDLTIWEQAKGIQMLLDFGETVDNISKQTGFSENTIRRRVKLLTLDADKFKKSVERGATLQDYAELDKIQDIELKNSVLENIGTPNFQWKLKSAIDKEKADLNKAVLIEKLNTLATQVESDKGMRVVRYLYGSQSDNNLPTDAGDKKYYFSVETYGIKLLEENSAADTESAAASNEAQQQLQERRTRLGDIGKQAGNMRDEFVNKYSAKKQHLHTIMEFAVRSIMSGGGYWATAGFLNMLDVEPPEDNDEVTFDAVSESFASSPERVLLVAAYCDFNESGKCYDWQCRYERNSELEDIYAMLEKLGYTMSEEERAYLNGTHKLFVRDDKPADQG